MVMKSSDALNNTPAEGDAQGFCETVEEIQREESARDIRVMSRAECGADRAKGKTRRLEAIPDADADLREVQRVG